MQITSPKTQNKNKSTRIVVQYSQNYIKRKGYEGLTLDQINQKEKERLSKRFLSKEV